MLPGTNAACLILVLSAWVLILIWGVLRAVMSASLPHFWKRPASLTIFGMPANLEQFRRRPVNLVPFSEMTGKLGPIIGNNWQIWTHFREQPASLGIFRKRQAN